MEPCVAVTLRENAAQAPSRTMSNADRTKRIRREVGLLKANLRVTNGVTAILTSWTPNNTTTWSTTSVLAEEVVGVTVVVIIKETTTILAITTTITAVAVAQIGAEQNGR